MSRSERPFRRATSRCLAATRSFLPAAIVVSSIVAIAVGVLLVRSQRGTVDERALEDPRIAALDADSGLPDVPLEPDRWNEWDDPSRDDWQTEAFSARANGVLSKLSDLLSAPDELETADLRPFLAETFVATRLFPETLEQLFEDSLLRVERSSSDPLGGRLTDAESLRAELRALVSDAGGTVTRVAIKIVGVKNAASPRTRQLVSVVGEGSKSRIETHTVWSIRWDDSEAPAPPRLSALEASDFERSSTRAATTTLFEDATASVLGGNPAYTEQFLHGMNHWFERLQDNRIFSLLSTPGLALGDVNGDGLDDLYVCQEGGLPNRLFVALPDGTVRDVTEASSAGWLESTRSALLLDLDNDGDADLAAAVVGALILSENDGEGHFKRRAALPTSHDTMSLTSCDFDLDGDLDLYLCAYNRDDLVEDSGGLAISSGQDVVYHDANSAAANQLFRNETAAETPWRFVDVTRETGLDQNNRRFSFAAAWEDYDGDGDQDLYVANDFGLNNLYRNEYSASGSRFVDVASTVGVEDRASGMSVSWSDFDRDGDSDLYVGNMYSAAGNRITYQASFKPEAPEVRTRIQRFARGNSLFRSSNGTSFDDVTEDSGTAMGRWAWSSPFVDVNNDGWDDLVVANGYLTTEDTGDL